MNIPREFIDLLIAKVDIVDLINTHLPLRKKSGANYFARCPFHNEKSASFSVSQPKQFYYCFGCGAHGNVIDFMMQHDRLNFPEAIESLARVAGIELPKSNDGSSYKKDESLPGLYDLMTQVTKYYYEQLSKSQRAIDYLKGRGISGQIAKQFSLGYAASGWSHILDLFGKTETDKKKLLDTGLVIRNEGGSLYDRFRDRIMFPIHDYRGRIIGFGGRILDQGEPKYLNSPETVLFQKGHELYGLHQALQTHRRLERIIIVEGYMDVIALFQQGISYAVATLGTATTTHHLHRLYRFTSDIIFCFDGDEAGRTAAWRAAQTILPIMQDNLQIRFLFLPDGEDPDSLVRKEGKDNFENRIKKAMSLSEFFFQTLMKQCDLSTMEGRARLASTAIPMIKQIPDGIYQGIMLDELAKRARVDLDEMKPTQTETAHIQVQPLISQKSKIAPALRKAMALLVQNPHLASNIKESLPPTKITGMEFFKQLIEIARQRPNINTGAFLEHWRGQKEESFVAKLSTEQLTVPETGIDNEFLGTIRQLTILAIDEEINHLLAKAAQGNLSEEEKRELAAWILKKKHVTV